MPRPRAPPCRYSVGEDRHQHGVRHTYQADQAQQQKQGANDLGVVDPAKAFDNVFNRRTFAGTWCAVHAHQRQADDHGDVADRIGGKAPAFSNFRHQNSGDGWADDARAIEHRGIQRDGVHQILFADHVDEEGLTAGNVERVDHSKRSRQHEDVPHVDAPGQGEERQNAREDHGSGLSGDHQALAIDAVGGDTSERSGEENRNLAGKADAAQQQRGSRHAVDQPRLGHGLHPGADKRDELSAEEELKVAVAQGAQGHGPFRQARLIRNHLFNSGEIVRFSHSVNFFTSWG